MNGPIWLAAFALAAMGCLSLGPEPPRELRSWSHPRIVASYVLLAIGVAGLAVDLARVLTR